MISMESYRIFLSVADCTSFSAAAKQLGLTVTKVSRAVADLEDELGAELLTRTTRQVALTPKGAGFAVQLRPALAALDAATGGLNGSNKSSSFNTLRIACGRAEGEALIAPAMPAFLSQHPKAEVRLDLMDRAVSAENEGYDLVLKLSAGDVGGEPLARCELALVASPVYCATHNRPYAAADVAQHRLLVWSGLKQWNFRGSEPLLPAAHFLSNDLSVLKKCCIAANGLALLPMAVVRDELTDQSLVQLLDGFEPRPLHLVAELGFRPAPPSSVQIFLDYLKGYFRQQRL